MNNLNTKLQGSNQQLRNELFQYVNAFERKLKLLEKQITEKNFVQLSRLNQHQKSLNCFWPDLSLIYFALALFIKRLPTAALRSCLLILQRQWRTKLMKKCQEIM